MFDNSRMGCVLVSLFAISVLDASTAHSMDQVVVKQPDGTNRQLHGQVVTEAEDGGLLLKTADGRLWAIDPADIADRSANELPFKPLSDEKVKELLLKEFPDYKVHKTRHYLICYNTSPAYAQWCGGLLERLYVAFHNYWKERGWTLSTSELPLVAMVFKDRDSYVRNVTAELGDSAGAIVAYYNQMSNRVQLYDLTGVEQQQNGRRVSKAERVNEILSSDSGLSQVATIVHEATHQLAYNCGLQTRVADNPAWVSEGLAVYFETPDLKSTTGWRNIGLVHSHRLRQFREYRSSREANSLEMLLRDDNRFRNAETNVQAYAEAWAFNYFLLKAKRKEYVDYLKLLAKKQPSVFDTPEERLEQISAAFGDLNRLEIEFIKFIDNLP